MAWSRFRARLVWLSVAVLVAGLVTGVGPGPAGADVSTVKGSAFGYLADNISIFGGAQPDTGPAPTVTLPLAGSASPITGGAASGLVKYGPATIFSSGTISVSTQGTTGSSGSVTSSSTLGNVNSSGQEVFTATSVSSTCTASESGRSGSTTITGGRLRTSEGDPNVDGDDTEVAVPANPAPNTAINGTIEAVGDTFRYVFNEQIANADGSITVNAAHLYLLGPTALGDVIIGQSVCGVTATAATTTTTAPGATTTTTAAGATTTTTAPGATTTTTTTAPATTTTTAPPAATTTTEPASATTTTAPASTTTVGGGAYGYYVSVGLFGGAPGTRGPAPTVTLPEGGSAEPITGSAPSAIAQFGPAILFSSDQIDVSTQGTPGGSVTSSAKVANVNRSGQEQLTVGTLTSTCTASAAGTSGSAALTGGRLTVSSGTDFDSEGDDTVVDLPANPAPNTPFEGKIENVGDSFRVVLNEQVRSGDSITVNAVHMYLLGPVAVGELIIGQSRCGSSTTAGGSGGGGTQAAAGTGTGRGLAGTGSAIAVFVALALLLVVGGSTTSYWVAGLRWRDIPRRMPWSTRGLLR